MSYDKNTRPELPKRLSTILGPSHPLCREDIIWVLHYAQKKVALKDPALLELSKPRILQIFNSYCEAAMLLLGSHAHFHADDDDIRACLRDLVFGLTDINPSS
ncbi:hypothetical protein [Paenibacillus dakarensis]|uniref:hypothetical protein n=1 Tax=Paenibacillus dakarensis TaxID=1527293 RepID=UPI0006D5A49E|nr:hypothetical protein [Paenibacillus dakarensis]